MANWNDFIGSGQLEVTIPPLRLLSNLLLAGVFGYILRDLFVRYGRSMSNRRVLGATFVPLTVTTTFIIMVVKSSLALSLGLVGALSIVRFRTAIKEPEELAFLFIAIAVGLGLGADQATVTLLAFVVLALAIWVYHYLHPSQDMPAMYLSIKTGPSDVNVADQTEKIIAILSKYCRQVNLKRQEDVSDGMELIFVIELDDFSQLNHCQRELKKLAGNIKVSFFDARV